MNKGWIMTFSTTGTVEQTKPTSLPPKLVDMMHEETNYSRHYFFKTDRIFMQRLNRCLWSDSQPLTMFHSVLCQFQIIFLSLGVFSSRWMLVKKINRFFFLFFSFLFFLFFFFIYNDILRNDKIRNFLSSFCQ